MSSKVTKQLRVHAWSGSCFRAGLALVLAFAGIVLLAQAGPEKSPKLPAFALSAPPPADPYQVQFVSATYSVAEIVPGVATITVSYGGGGSTPVTVDYSTADGTAVDGTDYTATSGTLTFEVGEYTKTFDVPILDNLLLDGSRTVLLSLTNVTGGAILGAQTTAELVIADDETSALESTAGEFSFASTSWTVTEYETTLFPGGPINPSDVSNDRDIPGATITVNRLNGSTGRVLVDYVVTNYFTTNRVTLTDTNTDPPTVTVTNIVIPSAIPDVDYIPVTNTLIFDHLQTSTNFVVPVYSRGRFDTNRIPPEVLIYLANPRPDPEENPLVVAPRLGFQTNASLFIPEIHSTNNNGGRFAIEAVNWKISEFGGDTRVARLGVIINRPYANAVSVGFRTRNAFGFAVRGGSDYTSGNSGLYPDTPHTDGAPRPNDTADYTPVSTTITIPAGNTRQVAEITITNDADVEFNEDILCELFQLPNEPSIHPNGGTATLTISYDDQPAGAADREWNPWLVNYTDPPFNVTPGANNNVNAVVVQSDGRVIIGGDFTAYNSIPINRIARLTAADGLIPSLGGSIDLTFNPGTGADGPIHALAIHPASTDTNLAPLAGKIVVAGGFTSFDGQLRSRIARLNTDGSLDRNFRTGAGANGPIYAVQIMEGGKVVIGGEFTFFNGVPRNRLARLNPDGSLDATFDPGTGANATVWALANEGALPPLLFTNAVFGAGPEENRTDIETFRNQGSVTFTYDSWAVEDSFRVYYEGVKLFDSGYISTFGPFVTNFTFGPGKSTILTVVVNEGGNPQSGTVWDYDLRIESFGGTEKLLLGGEFTVLNGVRLNHVARLFTDGAVDGSFNPGSGADGPVYAITSVGTKAVIGGDFHSVNFQQRDYIARLSLDGSLDQTFNPGTGFDHPVYSLVAQLDGKVLVGGQFTEYNKTRRVGLARVNADGTIDTGFMDTAYNQFAGIPRTFSFQPLNFIRSIALEADGNLIVGGSFTNIGGNQSWAYVSRPASADPSWTRQDKITRYNVARVIGGYTPGPGNLEYAFPYYTADENIQTRYVTTHRINGRLGTAFGAFATTNSVALSGDDYDETLAGLQWQEFAYVAPRSVGFTGLRYLPINITNDTLVEGDEILTLGLDRPIGQILLGGEYIPLGLGLGTISQAPFTIIDNDFDKGTLVFESRTFNVSEKGTNALISVIRTNGANGQVSATYFVRNGTAINGADYTNVQTGVLTFPSGVTNQTFIVPIENDVLVEPDETVLLVLTNATGGAVLPGGLSNSTDIATLFILDDDYLPGRINFKSLTYATNEGGGRAFITVERLGGDSGQVSVDVVVTNGTAVSGVDYLGFVTNLVWVHNETGPKTFAVTLIDNLEVEPDKTVSLILTNGRVGTVSTNRVIGLQSAATLYIQNDDQYGRLAFSQPFYAADENGTNVTITVVRIGGIAGTVSVDYQASTGSAVDGVDYVATSGTLTLLPGQISKSFSITVLDDFEQDGSKTVDLTLANAVNATLGSGATAQLTFVDNESFNIPAGSLDTSFNTAAGANNAVYQIALQPDGRVLMAGDFTTVNSIGRRRIARLMENGDLDPNFNAGTGPNLPIRAMILQDDGRVLIGGFFSQVHGTNRNHIARLRNDGSLDSFFNPGAGPDDTVYAMALQPDGFVAIGGSFNTVNGVSRPGVAVLTTNGSLSTLFNPGLGANGIVYAVAVQPFDGKIIIGGDFTLVDNISRPGIARLLPNGQVDPTFNPGSAANAPVRAIAVQPDGRILVGGSFTVWGETNRNYFARLEGDGSLDQQFIGSVDGGNGAVFGITLQADAKILVVGDFTKFNGVTRHRITRLYQNGKTDPTINFGDGANSFISQAILQPDRRILIGGGFTVVQGESRNYIARLHGGSIAGAGSVEFSRPLISVVESSGEIEVAVRRKGGTTGEVEVDYQSADISATAGLDYGAVSGKLVFPEGEVLKSFVVPVVDDALIEPAETVQLSLANPVGGAVLGFVPESTLTILSDDNVLTFATPSYSVNENTPAGFAPISVLRLGTTNGTVSVDYLTLSGTATGGIDYSNVSGTITFQPGETNKIFTVPILPDSLVEGAETIQLLLTNATGDSQYQISSAALTIVDDDVAPGMFAFSTVTYFVNEYETNAVITVVRTNGSSGIVEVNFAASDGSAKVPSDYYATAGTLSFGDGETVKTFNVPIVPDYDPELNETVILKLDNATGGAALANDTATLTIINNNLVNGAFSFAATNYVANESNLFVALTIRRDFGASGDVTVSYVTQGDTALPGSDFVAVTNTLSWANGEVAPKTVVIDLVNDGIVEGIEQFRVALVSPTGKATLGAIPTTTVIVQDDDTGPGQLGFTLSSYLVDENGTQAVVSVHRIIGNTGEVAIDAATIDGGTAIAGRDYVSTNATLVFPDGVTNVTFLVSILDNLVVEGSRTINLELTNPRNLTTPTDPPSTNGQIIAAVLTIQENDPLAGSVDAGFTTSEPDGPVNTIFFQTNNGKIVIGGDFTTFGGVARGYLARLNQNGALDTAFDAGALINRSVFAIARRNDGRLIVGGAFTNTGSGKVSYLMSLDESGQQDTNFFGGLSGVDNLVYAAAVQSDGKVLAGGLFTSVNGLTRQYVARLEANGVIDPNFAIGTGPDAAVRALRVQLNDKVVIAGDFTQVSGQPRGRIARLNSDGTLDSGFATAIGADGSVRAVAIQTDGKILIGGLFANVNGQPRSRIARLNVDGTLDDTFNAGTGADEFVSGLAIQPDGKIVVVGAFTTFGGIPRNRITRLNGDGSVDDSINFGTGADNFINAVALQADRKILIGGGFTEFSGQSRRYLARLNGGENIGSGEFVFSAASYSVAENAGSLLVQVRRLIGSSNAVSVAFATSDGTAVAGANYVATNGVINFGPGETVASFAVRLLDDANTNLDRTINIALSNPTGGATIGVPNTAIITVLNDDAIVGFPSVSYSVSENVGSAVITVERLSSTLGVATVNYSTGDGTAVGSADYLGQAGTLTFTNGQRFATFTVPIINDTEVEGNETVNLNLTAVTGAALGIKAAVLTIVDDDSSTGRITFSQPGFNVGEQAGFATITVQRQGGVSGSASVRFLTSNGTALNGADYLGTSGMLSFADGQVSKTFTVPILDDTLVEGAETVILSLYDVSAGVGLGQTNAVLTILPDEAVFEFAQTNILVTETNIDAVITVRRSGGGTGPTTVSFFTYDGTATNGLDYLGTNGTLAFAPGQRTNTFTVSILGDDLGEGDEFLGLALTNATGEAVLGTNAFAALTILDDDISFRFENPAYSVLETAGSVNVQIFRVGLTNRAVAVNFSTSDGTAVAGADYAFTSARVDFAAGQTNVLVTIPITDDLLGEGDEFLYLNLDSPTNGTTLGDPNQSVMTILDNEDTLNFAATGFLVDEGASNVVVTVRRSGTVNAVSVSYATSNLTATAGLDYTATSGALSFSAGEFEKFIVIPIKEDTLTEGPETFLVSLIFPNGGAAIIAPSNTVVTILDNDTVVQFASTTNTVAEEVTPAAVHVQRLGGTNSIVRVNYYSTNGTATAGADYAPVAGTLVFLPGQTDAVINVPIFDDLLIEGNETVPLVLVSPTNALLGVRSNVVLTIIDTDASILVPAGAAIVSESIVPNNGVIDPNEIVTVNFGLRNVGNVDTINLQATLLSTNGIQPQGTTTRSYGVLVAEGSTVVRSFAFRAVGTNGARVAATFQLMDGANNLGQVAFDFALGSGTIVFTNNGAITITSPTNGTPASPYASIINVSGISGTISKVTVTLKNLTHDYPSDLDLMLVGPAGQKVILMSDAGGSFAINNATFTFDDAAVAGLPFNSQIVSGTYRPTNYVSADSWPPPAPAGPYSTALSAFAGTSPNGPWALYVVDDTQGDDGNIAGGWSLNFTTLAVLPAASDLMVRVTDSPDPLIVGQALNYFLAVTNFGPSAATGVVVSNQLPAGVTFLGASASQGSCTYQGRDNMVICNLGNLANGGSASVTISTRTALPGLINAVAGVRGAGADGNPADNVHDAKTTVKPLVMNFSRQGDNLVIAWPADIPGLVLQYSDAIAPASWLPASESPVVVNGLSVVTISATEAHRFYRLRLQ